MNLSVPLIKQPENSQECGTVCINMILEYYGISCDYNEMLKEFEFYGEGVSMPQLGIFLMKHGFEVEIITLNPLLLTKAQIGIKKTELIPHLEKRKSMLKEERDLKTMSFIIEYVKEGGKIKPKIPSSSDIKGEIANKRPMIALLTSNFLQGALRFNFHFNVITGIDQKHIYVNDPLANEQGGKHGFPIKDYLFAIYASAYGDFDNASIMKIRKK